MTKHLASLILVLVLAFVPDRRMPKWRTTVSALALALILSWNIHTIGGIVQDFASITVSPAW